MCSRHLQTVWSTAVFHDVFCGIPSRSSCEVTVPVITHAVPGCLPIELHPLDVQSATQCCLESTVQASETESWVGGNVLLRAAAAMRNSTCCFEASRTPQGEAAPKPLKQTQRAPTCYPLTSSQKTRKSRLGSDCRSTPRGRHRNPVMQGFN